MFNIVVSAVPPLPAIPNEDVGISNRIPPFPPTQVNPSFNEAVNELKDDVVKNEPLFIENPEVPEEPATPFIPEVPDVPLVPDVPDVPLVPEVPDVPLVPEVPFTPDVPLMPDVPEVPSPPLAPLKFTTQDVNVPLPVVDIGEPNTITPVAGSYDVI